MMSSLAVELDMLALELVVNDDKAWDSGRNVTRSQILLAINALNDRQNKYKFGYGELPAAFEDPEQTEILSERVAIYHGAQIKGLFVLSEKFLRRMKGILNKFTLALKISKINLTFHEILLPYPMTSYLQTVSSTKISLIYHQHT